MDDMLTVETEVVEIGGASMELAQRVLRGEDVLIAATVRIACVADGRPCRIPAAIRASLGG
jgi:acyl-CoA thioester hydrolase